MRIAIYGYGNLARGVEAAVLAAPDAELVGVFTRREPSSVITASGAPVFSADAVLDFKDKIDVMVVCGGSATDLPVISPSLAESFNIVDSFDTHAKISEHFAACDRAARSGGRVALISAGWDPGLFSIMRLYASASLPMGEDYTFWGRGISQGHSDAIRRIEGVVDARQYTIPKPEALAAVREGRTPTLSTREKHLRECFVVAEEGADTARIEREIRSMPNYFADYDVVVHFVDLETLRREHGGMPHGGSVIRCGRTGLSRDNTHTMEFSLRLDSNPEFTGSVLVAYARAVDRIWRRGGVGALTVLDVAPVDLTPLCREELLSHMI